MSKLFTGSNRRTRLVVLGTIALLGAASSLAGYWLLSARERHVVIAQFEADAGQHIRTLEARFRTDVTAVYGLSAFINEAKPGTLKNFRTVFRGRVREDRDIDAVMWIPRVPAKSRAAHEATGVEEGLTGYRITELGPDEAVRDRAATKEDLFPVQYLEPLDQSAFWLGMDLSTVPSVKLAMAQAVDSGQLTVSAPIYMHGRVSVVALRPVLEALDLQDTAAARRQKLVGYLAVLIPVDQMMDIALRPLSGDIDVVLYDVGSGSQLNFVCSFDSKQQKTMIARGMIPTEPEGTDISVRSALDVPGRIWTTQCFPNSRYFLRRQAPTSWVALVLGLLVTAVVTAYVQAVMYQTVRVERLVVQRTSELQEANASLEREIRDRRLAQDALRESEHRFRALVENSSDWIWETDRAGFFRYVSPRVEELLGYSVDELVARRSTDLIVPHERSDAQALFEQAAERCEPLVGVESVFLHRNGRQVFVETNAAPILDAAGQVIGYRGITRDMTARRQAEAELAYERFLLNTLLQYSTDFIYFKDAESRFIRISHSLSKYFNLRDSSQAIGMSDLDIFGDENARQYLADEQEVMRSGRPVVNKEEEQISPAGDKRWLLTSKMCLRNASGDVVGTFGISRDITLRKQAEETLRLAKEAAEAANRAKSDFLANMSHEIRTPMNAIIGMTELLLDTEMSPSQRDYVRMVLQSGESLLSILNDILDFAKIEAGKLVLQASVFDLQETLGDTMKSLAFRAHSRKLELLTHFDINVPRRLVGDAGRLRQVVINLVGNAIKFTEIGEVQLRVGYDPQPEGRLMLTIAVSDTGIGIAPAKQATIFEAFEQADTSMTRRYGGTGLGLAICSQLVTLMEGKIWVESEVGKGSTFYLRIPVQVADEQEIPQGTPQFDGVRVLVVDDNATHREILQELLADWRFKVSVADSAEHAWQSLVEAAESGERFELVLADAGMPGRDGFSLASRIREQDKLSTVVIMMLSSGDRSGEIARCESLGVKSYVLKPVKPSELEDALAMALGALPQAESLEEPASGEKSRPLRILLAEDSPVNQKLAIFLLENEGHTVTVANDGKEAVAALESHPFDLVLMDVQMPEMDGFEAVAIIRAQERSLGTHTPIIAMTAHAMKGDRERCLEAGMDDYVPKPVRAHELFETIDQVLATVKNHRKEAAS